MPAGPVSPPPPWPRSTGPQAGLSRRDDGVQSPVTLYHLNRRSMTFSVSHYEPLPGARVLRQQRVRNLVRWPVGVPLVGRGHGQAFCDQRERKVRVAAQQLAPGAVHDGVRAAPPTRSVGKPADRPRSAHRRGDGDGIRVRPVHDTGRSRSAWSSGIPLSTSSHSSQTRRLAALTPRMLPGEAAVEPVPGELRP